MERLSAAVLRIVQLFLGLTLIFAGGCATNATAQQLKTRAEFDLNCSQDQIEVVELDARTRGVRGCGKRATYVEQCKPCANGYLGCECTWLMNVDATQPR